MGTSSKATSFVLHQGLRGGIVGALVGEFYFLAIAVYFLIFGDGSEGFLAVGFIWANCFAILPIALISGLVAAVISRIALSLNDPNLWNLAKTGGSVALVTVSAFLYLWGNNSTFPLPFGILYMIAIPFFILGSIFVSASSAKLIRGELQNGTISTGAVNLATVLAIAVFGFAFASNALPWEVYETHAMTWQIEESSIPNCNNKVVFRFANSPENSIQVCSDELIQYLEDENGNPVTMELVAWNENFYRNYSLIRIDDWRPGTGYIHVSGTYCNLEACPPPPINDRYHWRQKP